MSITLESRPCPICQQENSIHIDNCHQCGAVLPWAGEASTKALTEPRKMTGYESGSEVSKGKVIGLYIVGGLIFCFGVLLWLGNRSGVFPTFSGAGFMTMGLAGVVWRVGDRWLLGPER